MNRVRSNRVHVFESSAFSLWRVPLAMIVFLLASVGTAQDRVELFSSIAMTDGSASADADAAKAVARIQEMPSSAVIGVLEAFDKATPRGRNWLRSLAADVSDNGDFQSESLTAFLNDRANDADARYVAFQLLTQNDPQQKETLLANAETDPSLPIRYLKIQSLIKAANDQSDDGEKIEILQSVVRNGRSPAQLKEAVKMLGELDVNVELADELGLFRSWNLIGSFDNTGSQHFDTAYVPENRYLEQGTPIDVDAAGDPKQEQGKQGSVAWQSISSDDQMGMVDLNEPLSNEKDGTAYAFAVFTLSEDQFSKDAEARLGCICANKVWVNGKLVISNDVYHSGTRIDQYTGDCELVKGENTVLVKVLQNAQTESWAQDWEFQFRLTRPDGSAIKPTIVDSL